MLEILYLTVAVLWFMLSLPFILRGTLSHREGYEELPTALVVIFTCIAHLLLSLTWPVLLMVWAMAGLFRRFTKVEDI
ncbi:MAG: hypothetical protein ACQ5SW_09630 [Sphaerochaetaceae bacterium]